MNLRDSLHDHARNRGHPTRFPGERRTTTGLFSGLDGRLVHVGRDGRLRDFSAPLLDRAGLATARFGVRVDDDVRWLDAFDARTQRYVDDTALVESTFADGDVEVTRHDLTVDATHRTHLDVTGPVDAIVVYCSFRPDGTEARVGKLVYDDRGVVETYHRHEHDYLASATGFAHLDGRRPADAADVLEHGPEERPRDVTLDDYEESRLGGDVVATVPLADGTATVATALKRDVADRDATVDAVRDRVRDVDATSLLTAARKQAPDVDADAAADVRALALLSGPTGARVAGPDFDPLYANSGGYGYTWFRDDAEIARYLLAVDRDRDLGLDDWHDRSAALYVDTQLADGSWPHRVWPSDASLAPGWANSRVEGDGDDYQADQTASVVAALADYHRHRDWTKPANDESAGADAADAPDLAAVSDAIADGVAALDDSLREDGLPAPCQNAWEDMTGRFAHTAATYLAAYASVARTDFDGDLAARAAGQARAVLGGLDALWSADRGAFALRLEDGERDERLDASTFALVDAIATADAAGLDVADDLPRLVSHVATTLEELERETDAVRGLVRYEDDDWRRRHQDDPKIWTVSTAWGAVAAAELAALLGRVDAPAATATADVEYDANDFGAWADDLLAELQPGGSLSRDGAYLPEQVFDDGTADSATPLGWPHAIRLATVTKRRAAEQAVPVPEDD